MVGVVVICVERRKDNGDSFGTSLGTDNAATASVQKQSVEGWISTIRHRKKNVQMLVLNTKLATEEIVSQILV
jgi:hypothetical protein